VTDKVEVALWKSNYTSQIPTRWRYNHLHLRIVQLDIDATPMWLAKSISAVLASCSIIALAGLLVSLLY